ncbi:MAG: ABC transporter substrate-binding protein [Eubacteriaceae bacterium]|nr:ABC transporter substrate-binding protein [Eubacteriaceae bacterium]
MKKSIALLLAVLMCLAMFAGCGGKENGGGNDPQKQESTYPQEYVTYMDMKITVNAEPQRVIASNTNTADQLYAMGLGDRIIGVCYKNSLINPKYQAQYDAARVINEKAATLEQIVAEEPDFVYGRSSAFSEKNGTTHDILTSYGISSLSSIEGYKLGADVEDVYTDFEILGKIFNKQDRAAEIINEMKTKIANVENAVKDKEVVKVFVYDATRDDGAYTCGNNFTAKLIRHAGGVNIFEDMEVTWATVSWESIVDANPDVIIINDYGSEALEHKIEVLKTNPALQSITAVKEGNIISVTLCECFASSMTADTVEKFAKAFHPDCFK